MRKLCVLAVLLISSLVWGEPHEWAPPRYDMLLSPQDVERVCALEGLRLVPRNPMIGANGTLNFARSRGPIVLRLNGEAVDPQEFAKQKKSITFRSMYAFQFKGLGEDAYQGPAQAPRPYILSFQKGRHWMTLTSGISRHGGRPFLSMEEMQELARLILQRL